MTVFVDGMRTTLNGVPGLNRTTLLRPAAEGLPYLSTMEFDSKDDFLAWLRSDSFKAAPSDDQAPGMRAPSAVEQHTPVGDIILGAEPDTRRVRPDRTRIRLAVGHSRHPRMSSAGIPLRCRDAPYGIESANRPQSM